MSSKFPKSEKKDASSYIFLVLYFIYLVIQLLSTLNKFWGIPNVFNYVIMGVLLILVFINKYNIKVIIKNIVILGIVIIVSIQTTNATNFLLTYLMIFCSSFVDFKKIIKLHLVTLSFFMIFAFLLYKIGYLSELNYVTHLRDGNTVRYSLGYLFPTFMPNFFFHLVLIYIYFRKKMYLIEVLILSLINQYIFIYTDTKSAYYLTILALILSYIYKRFKFDKIIKEKTIQLIYFLTMVFFIFVPTWLSYIYDPGVEWQFILNRMLTGRLTLGAYSIEQYGLPIFGTKVEWIVLEKAWLLKDYFYVDSSSLNMYITYGLVFSLLLYIMFYNATFKLFKLNPVSFVVLAILLLHSAFDPQFFEIRYNPFIFLVGWILNPRKVNMYEKRGIDV